MPHLNDPKLAAQLLSGISFTINHTSRGDFSLQHVKYDCTLSYGDGENDILHTYGMEEAGYISQIDYSHTVKEGELYTVLFGDLVAVGYDPETGEDRDLTDNELRTVSDYFTKVSAPGSGFREVLAIQSGAYRRESEEHVTLKDEAKSSREAAEKLSSDREPEGPMRDGQSIE